MFKAIILLTRRDGTSHAEFAAWWLERHAPLARQLPGCRRLVFNLVEPDAAGSNAVDGISELWFDSREAFDAAYATDLGRQVTADTLANVGARTRLFVDEVVELE